MCAFRGPHWSALNEPRNSARMLLGVLRCVLRIDAWMCILSGAWSCDQRGGWMLVKMLYLEGCLKKCFDRSMEGSLDECCRNGYVIWLCPQVTVAVKEANFMFKPYKKQPGLWHHFQPVHFQMFIHNWRSIGVLL